MSFSLKLPSNYSSREVMAFQARDPEGLAERLEPNRIRKAFVFEAIPLVLDISLAKNMANCRIEADRPLPHATRTTLQQIARNLLALRIDPEPFEAMAKEDNLLASLVQKQTGLRIPHTTTPFEALAWAIIGQQINLSFAITLRRSFIQLAGTKHSSGLWCHPDASAVARLNPDHLGQLKFSRAKAETLVRMAQLVDSGKLPLDEWQNHSPEEIQAALLAIKGIGPWTVNYTLLRGFAFADCSLHGDAAIRNALNRLSGSATKPTIKEIETLLQRYRPHRSMTAAHLWKSLHVAA
ncbi:DNA-3-methyladenine glycosylase family protein [Pedosphaera parvula]|uniref:DNA-3-methyladenine glycosylase II n=1 Tax=Pedosphaera parvula (strain Ellin514) TaxID=320771 RepID=B9XBY0_PEDPL|nr:DNA-3-methyladenine glycosylase 2 [Pedosphaera parvula]EEF62448.1 HhH-GPD family protein [Pedosphaera parvula Ellin514]